MCLCVDSLLALPRVSKLRMVKDSENPKIYLNSMSQNAFGRGAGRNADFRRTFQEPQVSSLTNKAINKIVKRSIWLLSENRSKTKALWVLMQEFAKPYLPNLIIYSFVNSHRCISLLTLFCFSSETICSNSVTSVIADKNRWICSRLDRNAESKIFLV